MKKQKKSRKKEEKERYSVNRFADKQEYNKSIKKEEGGKLTSGTTKLTAISFQRNERIEDSGDCWRKLLLEFLKFSNSAAAKEVDLRM